MVEMLLQGGGVDLDGIGTATGLVADRHFVVIRGRRGLQRSETASATTGALAMSTSTSDATTSASGATRSRGCGGNADG